MPWKLDYIWGGGPNPPSFGFEEGQDNAVVLRRPHAIPDEQHWPVRIFQDSKHKTLPDYTTGPTTGDLLVSKKFRALVEAWDPVQHSYIPVALRLNSGEVLEDAYFIFVPQDPIENGIVADESEVRDIIIKGKMLGYEPTTLRPRLMWRNSVVGDRHLWTDKYLRSAITVSDQLFDAMQRQGVVGFQAHEARFSEKEL